MSADELVKLCEEMQRGNQSAFGTLYKELYTPLYRFAYGLTFSREDAEDLVQESFKKMVRAILHFRGGNVLAWLFTITRNTFYDKIRKYHKEVALDDQHEEVFVEQMEHDSASDINDIRALRQIVKQLSEHERELLLLRYWQKLDMKQIAAIVGKTHEAVRQEMSRIIKKLRKQLWTKK